MTSPFASEKSVKYLADLAQERSWQGYENPKYVERIAAVAMSIRFATGEIEQGKVDLSGTLGERLNQILDATNPGDSFAWKPVTQEAASGIIGFLKKLPKKNKVEASRRQIVGAIQAAPSAPRQVAVPGLPGVHVDAPAADDDEALVAAERKPVSANVEIEDGMYLLDGEVYKVQHAVHGSGRQYAKHAVARNVHDIDGQCFECASCQDCDKVEFEVEFVFAPGVIGKLRPEHRMTYEQAKEFGMLYGTCCRCGRTLTDELSIALGIGPKCGDREFGGSFKQIVKNVRLEIKNR